MCVFLYIHAQCVYSCLMCVCLVLLRALRADINEAFLSAELCQYNKPLTWLITALLPLCVCEHVCIFVCTHNIWCNYVCVLWELIRARLMHWSHWYRTPISSCWCICSDKTLLHLISMIIQDRSSFWTGSAVCIIWCLGLFCFPLGMCKLFLSSFVTNYISRPVQHHFLPNLLHREN